MGHLEFQTAVSVWNAIRYLDSPTSYREHLPYVARSASLHGGEFVLLDVAKLGWPKLGKLSLMIILVCTILFLLLRP